MSRTTDVHQTGPPTRWGRARLGGVVAIALVASLAATGWSHAAGPDPSGDPADEPALPDQLFDVPANIPDIADDPLHEPVAVAYQADVRTGVFDETLVPVVVGAETGRVRSVRDAGERGRAVPSPDGTMLALTRPGGIDSTSSQLVVLDVVRDRTVRYDLPDEGLGAGVSDVVWTPDGTELMLTAEVTTEISRDENDAASTARLVPGSLDLQTGRWEEHDYWTHAISPDGRRAVGADYSAGYVIEASGTEPVSLTLGDTRDDTTAHREGLAFSPDGGRIAALTAGPYEDDGLSHSYAVAAYDASTAERVAQVDLGNYQGARVLGWGERGLVVQTTSETGVWVGRIGVTDGEPTTSTLFTLAVESYQGEVAIPTAMLDADSRDAEPPDAPFDWLAWIPGPFVLVMAGIVGLVVAVDLIIRRVRSRRG